MGAAQAINPGPETEAEVVAEQPKPAEAPKPPAKASPAGAFTVFDGPVDEAKNAKRKGAAAAPQPRQAKNGAKARGKAPAAAEPAPGAPPAPDQKAKALIQAKGVLRMYESQQIRRVSSRYQEILTPESLVTLQGHMAFSEQELELMADPLADGLLEFGLELPWWMRLAVTVSIVSGARQQMLDMVELRYQQHQRAQKNEAPAAPPAS